MKRAESSDHLIKKMPGIRRAAVSLSQDTVVKAGALQSGQTLPLVVQPQAEGLHLASWLKHNLQFIQTNLLRYGGILFRGFDLRTQSDFEEVLKPLPYQLMHYIEGATPRTQLTPNVYTSTEYPPDQNIALHNELTYVITWPMKIWFFCLLPAQHRGETPIADVRKVFQRIAPAIRKRFEKAGWMLVRNYGERLSLPWQSAFRTSSKSEVEAYCRSARIDYEWKSGEHLRTRQVRPAVATHPLTGEAVWFNHVAFWHVSSLAPEVRQAMRTMFEEQELPYNTYYGDGERIEDSVVEALRHAYQQETVAFPWQKGDFLMLENMLVAHGRNPYAGERRILVAMGDPFSPYVSSPADMEA
jgi:alpha-ketoglutarate-dependent taurine dioxygenase